MVNSCLYFLHSSGSLWNLKSSLSSAQQSQTLAALAATLSRSLILDAGALIPELWHAEAVRLSKETTSATESDHTDERPAEMEEDVRDEKINGRKPNGQMSKTKSDISDLLPVSLKLLSFVVLNNKKKKRKKDKV